MVDALLMIMVLDQLVDTMNHVVAAVVVVVVAGVTAMSHQGADTRMRTRAVVIAMNMAALLLEVELLLVVIEMTMTVKDPADTRFVQLLHWRIF